MELQDYSKPDNIWFDDYLAAFNGDIMGIDSGDHYLAREFADSENSISEGDFIELGEMGAYSDSMKNNFNGFYSEPKIFVKKEKNLTTNDCNTILYNKIHSN